MAIRHFLDINQIKSDDLHAIIKQAKALKEQALYQPLLKDKALGMIFEKPSTRTRVSFEMGMKQLGGHAVILSAQDMQLGHSESIADTAKVLSRYVDAIMLRTTAHENLLEMAENASIPVINALTDKTHPCQIMADILTFEEKKGPIAGKTVAWVGDCNNVALSWAHAAEKFSFNFQMSCPPELMSTDILMGKNVYKFDSPAVAVKGADAVVTDTWVSMGMSDKAARHQLLKPYQVTADMMRLAKPDAIFMHCLPAHREEEMTAEVIDGPQSVVFDEAENRLHAQKAILLWCFADAA